MCPGDTLVFTCITSYQEVVFVGWRINTQTRSLHNDYKTDQINSFMLAITDNTTNSTITSTATNESVPSNLNGTVVSCSGDINLSHYSNTLTVHIAGKIHNE